MIDLYVLHSLSWTQSSLRHGLGLHVSRGLATSGHFVKADKVVGTETCSGSFLSVVFVTAATREHNQFEVLGGFALGVEIDGST